MAAPSGPLRAGLIGLGSMGRNHARVLSSLAGVELVAVADPAGDPSGAAHGVPVLTSFDALLDRGLDYCVVAAPTALHLETGLQLAAAGVHALIEKPVATNTDTAQQLVAAFEKADLVGAVGHIERYNPALQQLRTRLESGELGEIYQIATRRQGPFPGRISDVGVVMDLASHDLDLTAFISGSEFAAISARTAHKSGREHEDLVAATGQLQDGTITNHLVNWLSPMKERVTVVTGDKGTFIADTLTADLTFHANGTVALDWQDIAHFRGITEGDMIRYAFAKPEPLRTEHEAFRDAVLGKDSGIVTLAQGMAAVRVAEAALESAATGGAVRLADR
ncbi:MAG TPA: Gfo/Idh/MocA family oxidoreductase [Jatrophihabitans sp.]|nr:Gfo/Idh/MocA family oxidoreductase [Jatrophihabitans sp.]